MTQFSVEQIKENGNFTGYTHKNESSQIGLFF